LRERVVRTDLERARHDEPFDFAQDRLRQDVESEEAGSRSAAWMRRDERPLEIGSNHPLAQVINPHSTAIGALPLLEALLSS
jgi:hypothetical protein